MTEIRSADLREGYMTATAMSEIEFDNWHTQEQHLLLASVAAHR
jgi:hypothetical protein